MPINRHPEVKIGVPAPAARRGILSRHPAPFYLDDKMHDLKLDRFFEPEVINGQYNTAAGPIKTFTLRGIKDSPPYLHDGRCLTLEDTVEFFNLVTGVKLTDAEKEALVAFMRQL